MIPSECYAAKGATLQTLLGAIVQDLNDLSQNGVEVAKPEIKKRNKVKVYQKSSALVSQRLGPAGCAGPPLLFSVLWGERRLAMVEICMEASGWLH